LRIRIKPTNLYFLNSPCILWTGSNEKVVEQFFKEIGLFAPTKPQIPNVLAVDRFVRLVNRKGLKLISSTLRRSDYVLTYVTGKLLC